MKNNRPTLLTSAQDNDLLVRSSEYETRAVPENLRHTACDLPGMFFRCSCCNGILLNFTIHPSKPNNICDDCHERQAPKK